MPTSKPSTRTFFDQTRSGHALDKGQRCLDHGWSRLELHLVVRHVIDADRSRVTAARIHSQIVYRIEKTGCHHHLGKKGSPKRDNYSFGVLMSLYPSSNSLI